MEFKDIKLSPEMFRALDTMGFGTATPVQIETIPAMLEKRDLIVQAPTGSGKTCAFGIPTIELIDISKANTQFVILCPTRELAIQITDVLHKLTLYIHGIRICPIYGGARFNTQIAALRRKPQIIVATPGRLMDHMRRKTVNLEQVSCVVLDEADRMLDMGFREDIDIILKSVPEERQTILFSATLSKEIKQIAKEYQKDAKIIHIKQDTLTVDTVKQYYTKVPKGEKINALKLFLKEKLFNKSLIFVGTKSMADTVAEELSKDNFSTEVIHGDIHQRQRDSVMKKYRTSDVNILVATDVAARGIDVEDIDAVINFDIPNDSDSYVHRIGRTGRANKNGVAYTFLYAREQSKLDSIIKDTKATIKPFTIDGIKFDESKKQPRKRNFRKPKPNRSARSLHKRKPKAKSLKSNKAR